MLQAITIAVAALLLILLVRWIWTSVRKDPDTTVAVLCATESLFDIDFGD